MGGPGDALRGPSGKTRLGGKRIGLHARIGEISSGRRDSGERGMGEVLVPHQRAVRRKTARANAAGARSRSAKLRAGDSSAPGRPAENDRSAPGEQPSFAGRERCPRWKSQQSAEPGRSRFPRDEGKKEPRHFDSEDAARREEASRAQEDRTAKNSARTQQAGRRIRKALPRGPSRF